MLLHGMLTTARWGGRGQRRKNDGARIGRRSVGQRRRGHGQRGGTVALPVDSFGEEEHHGTAELVVRFDLPGSSSIGGETAAEFGGHGAARELGGGEEKGAGQVGMGSRGGPGCLSSFLAGGGREEGQASTASSSWSGGSRCCGRYSSKKRFLRKPPR